MKQSVCTDKEDANIFIYAAINVDTVIALYMSFIRITNVYISIQYFGIMLSKINKFDFHNFVDNLTNYFNFLHIINPSLVTFPH